MQKEYKILYERRYQECFHWIKDSFLLRREKGLLNSIFWSLPIIFIEGKVVCAFYRSKDSATPCLDTINGKYKLFKFKSFEKAFKKVDIRKPIERKYDEREFDFLDYFGIPCCGEEKELYFCHPGKFDLFEGEIKIWVVGSYDRVTRKLLDWKYHNEKLRRWFEDISELYKGELRTNRKQLADKLQKKDFLLFGHRFEDYHNAISFPTSSKFSPEIKLSDYLYSAFDNLHNALLASLEWKQYPCRVFILINDRLFSPGLRFILTKRQKQYYEDQYKLLEKCSPDKDSHYMKEMIREKDGFDKTIVAFKGGKGSKDSNSEISALGNAYRQYVKAKKGSEDSNSDVGSYILEHAVHTGVSSVFKQKGLPELFLEKAKFTLHPIIHKQELIEKAFKKARDIYTYPPELSKIEPFFLIQLPNFEKDKVENQEFSYEYEFAMIPIFFRDHPFGCIAFFNPEAKKKEDWYRYLYKVFTILGEKEKAIYQAAINDLCQQTLRVFETSTKNIKFVIDSINKEMTQGLFSGHFFIGHSKKNLLENIKKYYSSLEANFNKMDFEGEPQDDIINGKKTRGYRIKDRANDKESNCHFACVDSKDHYSPWEIQTDIDVKENIEAGLLTYSRKIEILRHGSRTAVAAIMGRNMSHNIGSHVLSYWARIIGEELLNVGGRVQTREENDWIRYSKFLFDYLRGRMDFIAEISTTNPSWVTSMAFCEDILYPFLKQNALLNYIAMSEGIHFEDCTKVSCTENSHHKISFNIIYKGKPIFTWRFDDNNIKYLGYDDEEEYSKIKKEIKINNDDPIVAIPHGITGVHAFYAIVENFIRNSAKHGGSSLQNNEPFVITIVLDDSLEDLIKVTISDNIGNCTPAIIKELNKGLRERLTDKRGIINPGKWGLKETKISACYLRMGGPDDVDANTDFHPKWSNEAKTRKYLATSCYECHLTSKCDTGESNVSYDVYLQKPKEAMILLKANSEKQQKDMLKWISKKGITEIYLNELSEQIKKSIPHRFLVNLHGDSEDIEKNAPYLPMRYIQINDQSYKTDIGASDPILEFYEHWFNKYYLPRLKDKSALQIIFRSSKLEGTSIDNGIIKYANEQNFDSLALAGNKIIFDDHSEGIKRINTDILYYQGVSAANPTKRLLDRMEKNAGDDSKQKLRMFELAEAALTRVLIADERIWKASLKLDSSLMTKGIEKKRHELLHLMNIQLVEIRNKKVGIGAVQCLIGGFDPDFIVIHQGLIDKMSDKERLFLDGILSRHRSFLVITSGRGLPNGMKDKKYSSARFLEISALEKFIEEYDKLALVQVLYSLRRPPNV